MHDRECPADTSDVPRPAALSCLVNVLVCFNFMFESFNYHSETLNSPAQLWWERCCLSLSCNRGFGLFWNTALLLKSGFVSQSLKPTHPLHFCFEALAQRHWPLLAKSVGAGTKASRSRVKLAAPENLCISALRLKGYDWQQCTETRCWKTAGCLS